MSSLLCSWLPPAWTRWLMPPGSSRRVPTCCSDGTARRKLMNRGLLQCLASHRCGEGRGTKGKPHLTPVHLWYPKHPRQDHSAQRDLSKPQLQNAGCTKGAGGRSELARPCFQQVFEVGLCSWSRAWPLLLNHRAPRVCGAPRTVTISGPGSPAAAFLHCKKN